jgi:uroporphyrinogen decarboxylase
MTGAERLLAACRGEPVDATPAWFMRQSGGSMPRYRELRQRRSVLEIAKTPALAAEVAVEAVDRLGADAAVLFADIMLPVEAMGVPLTLTLDGPRIESPIRSREDVGRLRVIDARADLGFVLEAIRGIKAALGARAAVVGIAGGPFTLAAYMIEGRPSRDQLVARRLMHADPALWAALLDRITDATVGYVEAQATAGADVIQVFDSWAGALGPAAYDRFVAPWSRRILDAIHRVGIPSVHFAAAGAALVERLADGASVLGVDAGQSLADARRRVAGVAVQGNLDPTVLAADWATVADAVRAVLAENDGRPGHVFNTGHAVPRDTPPERLCDVVRLVHDETAAAGHAEGDVAAAGAAR